MLLLAQELQHLVVSCVQFVIKLKNCSAWHFILINFALNEQSCTCNLFGSWMYHIASCSFTCVVRCSKNSTFTDYIQLFTLLYCFVLNIIVSIGKVIHRLKFRFILLIVVMVTCKITSMSLWQMSFQATVFHKIKWFAKEKVVASRVYIFVARVWSMKMFWNQHWLQDTTWNNMFRNKHAIERLTFCLINICKHSTDRLFYWCSQWTQNLTICYLTSQLNIQLNVVKWKCSSVSNVRVETSLCDIK